MPKMKSMRGMAGFSNRLNCRIIFNSKKWYHGTVSPEEFNNSMLSEIERKNADFLAQVEFGMDPKGYQLDAE